MRTGYEKIRNAVILLFCVIAFYTGISAGAASCEDTEKAGLTVMVYMCGSNLERLKGSARDDINEMLASGYDAQQVNVVLYTGGCKKWKTGFSATENEIYLLDPVNETTTRLWGTEHTSMGEAETLSGFLNLVTELCPAEKYALILWDHGAGPLNGVCFDELSDNDPLTLIELDQALEKSPFNGESKLAWIGFDACLMANVETAAICAHHAEYMIASQEPEPGPGWNYAFLGCIRPSDDGKAVGEQVVETYFEALKEKDEKGTPLTMAVLDLTDVEELKAAVEEMFDEIDGAMEQAGYPAFSRARDEVNGIARSTGTEYDLVDLTALTERYAEFAPETADRISTALEQVIVYQHSNMSGENGLSVFYPYYNKAQYEKKGGQYPEISAAAAYSDHIGEFTAQWMTGRTRIWRELVPEQTEDGFVLQLNDTQAAEYAHARLVIAEDCSELNSEQYSFIYYAPDVTIDDWNVLHASWDRTALYFMDAEGNVNSGYCLRYLEVDGMILLYGMLRREYANVSEYDENNLQVVFRFRKADNGELVLIDVLDQSDETLEMGTVQEVDLSQWSWFETIFIPSIPSEDDQGNLAAFSDWERSSWMFGIRIDLHKGGKFVFSEEYFNSKDRIVMFEIYDIYGNRYGSEPLLINNPNRTMYDMAPVQLNGQDVFSGSVTGFAQVTSPEDGYELYLKLRNETDQEISLMMTDVVFNDTITYAKSIRLFSYFYPGQENQSRWDFSMDDLQKHGIGEPQKITFSVVSELTGDESAKETRLIGRYTIELPLSDTSTFRTPDFGDVIASAESDGVRIELMSYEPQPDEEGTLFTGVLHIINETDAGVQVDAELYHQIALNGYLLKSAFLCKNGYAAPHSICYAPFQVKDHDFYGTEETLRYPEVYDLTTLRQIAFNVWIGENEKREFVLPLAQPVSLTAELPAKRPFLMETDAFALRYLNSAVIDDKLYVRMVAENRSDKELRLGVNDVFINNEENQFILTDMYGVSLFFDYIDITPETTGMIGIRMPLHDQMSGEINVSFDVSFRDIHEENGRKRQFDACQIQINCEQITEGAVPPACVTVVQAEEKVVGSFPVFREQVTMTQEAGLYRKVFQWQLSDEERTRLSKAQVLLLARLPQEVYSDYYCLIGLKVMEQDADGTLYAEMNTSVLTDAADGHLVLTCRETVDESGNVLLRTLSGGFLFKGEGLGSRESMPSMTVEIDMDQNEARLYPDEVLYMDRGYSDLQVVMTVLQMESAEQEYLPGVNELLLNDRVLIQNATLPEEGMHLWLHPLDETDDVYVCYWIQFTDGTQYTTRPVPWQEAGN